MTKYERNRYVYILESSCSEVFLKKNMFVYSQKRSNENVND